MDYDKLQALTMSTSTRTYLRRALRWVQDVKIYEEAIKEANITRHFKKHRFTNGEMEQMLHLKFENTVVSGQAGWPVFGFPVAQEKGGLPVLRPIWEPALNAAIQDNMLQPLFLPSRRELLEASIQPDGTDYIWVQLDARSCFDQMRLQDGIKPFFSFLHLGEEKSLIALPMGFRASVEVASAILWALLDFPRDNRVSVISFVDNIRFGGPRGQTADAVLAFVGRASEAGYQLDNTPTTPEEVYALHKINEDFLGLHFNHQANTRSLPVKSIEKLKIIASIPRTPSLLQLASAIGLLTWTATILDFQWHKAWHLLRKYASATVHWSPTRSVSLSEIE